MQLHTKNIGRTYQNHYLISFVYFTYLHFDTYFPDLRTWKKFNDVVFEVLKYLSTSNHNEIDENVVKEIEAMKNSKTFSIPNKIKEDLNQYEERHVLNEIKTVLKDIESNFANAVDI